jgi:hypothetical protein
MSLFYEMIGVLLGRASEALTAGDLASRQDERSQRELRQITTLLRRISVIWPQLFLALAEESAILEATLRTAVSTARAYQLAATDEGAVTGVADPLIRYRRLLSGLDAMVILLYEHADEPWARAALRSLRRGLAAAADVQGRLVEAMLKA